MPYGFYQSSCSKLTQKENKQGLPYCPYLFMKKAQTGCIMISTSVIKYHLGVLCCKADSDSVGVLRNLITEMKLFFLITIKKNFLT